MLTISHLTAGYGSGPAIIHDVDMHVSEGEIVTLIGPNGAGKSTVLRSIFGLTKIHDGTINYFGERLSSLSANLIIRRGICYVPQGRSIFPSMTVEENLQMGGFTLSSTNELKQSLKYAYSRFPILHQKREQKAKLLSGGQQQMLSLGRSLMVRPKMLLLDEPSIGLSPKIVIEVFEKCLEIKREGTSIFMVEQNANLALEYSDRAYVLELGRVRLQGTGKEILADPRVGELYLGKS
jgi:ABC-type branched-subunit amino acid transport system ATPase component